MENLDNRRVAPYFPPHYYLAMKNNTFKDRVLAAMQDAKLSKAELSRRSKVPYHTIDKFLKRDGQTGSDNAVAIANALGIKVDDESTYEELREVFSQLSQDQQAFLLQSARGLIVKK